MEEKIEERCACGKPMRRVACGSMDRLECCGKQKFVPPLPKKQTSSLEEKRKDGIGPLPLPYAIEW